MSPSLPRPGGNITGFTHTDAGMGGKWLGLLKEIAPGIKRAGIMFNPDTAAGAGSFFLGSFVAGARALAVELVALPVRSAAEIEAAIAGLGPEQAGLAAMDDFFMAVHQATIVSSSVRNSVPAIFPGPGFVKDGGLISHVADFTDLFRGAAGYVDRILRGEKPADLPVQTPTKFVIAINLRTARTLASPCRLHCLRPTYLGPVQKSRPAPQAIAQRFSAMAQRAGCGSAILTMLTTCLKKLIWLFDCRALLFPNAHLLFFGWAILAGQRLDLSKKSLRIT